MKTYIITRPDFWGTQAELEFAAGVSSLVGREEMPDAVRWIRSYVTRHEGGRLGTVCVYQAISPEALRAHAWRVGMPADSIIETVNTFVLQPDPAA